MPLFDALAEYSLNDPKPAVVSANLLDRTTKFADMAKAWQQADPIQGADFRLGVTGLAGPTVEEEMRKKDASVGFGKSRAALNAVLKEMDAKQDRPARAAVPWARSARAGPVRRRRRWPAQAFPQFPLIVALDDSDLPRTDPVWATNAKTGAKTMIVEPRREGQVRRRGRRLSAPTSRGSRSTSAISWWK